jgi:integrase
MNNTDPFISELERQKEKEVALRYNKGKLRWSLIDWKSLEPMVRVLEKGAQKYDDHNWKKGMPTSQISESLLRHMFAFMNGEDNDLETNESHLGHVMCNVMFLIYNLRENPQFDDRQRKTNTEKNR